MPSEGQAAQPPRHRPSLCLVLLYCSFLKKIVSQLVINMDIVSLGAPEDLG